MTKESDGCNAADVAQISVILARRPGGGTGAVSVSIAWGMGTYSVLLGMQAELDAMRFRLAWRIVEHWSSIMPLVFLAEGIPRLITHDKADDIQELFHNAVSIATLTRIVRTVLPHHADNEERDEYIIADTREFCGEQAETIRSFEGNDFEIECWVFKKLAWHMRELLGVALGDHRMEEFTLRHEEMEQELLIQIGLNETPEN